MNRTIELLKLFLLVAPLVTALSCTSPKPGAPAVAPNNSNANPTPLPVNRAAKKNDPKVVCAWLSEFAPTEHKLYTGSIYNCKSEKTEELGSGKHLYWTYEPFGTKENIEWLELTLSASAANKPEVIQKAEDRFVKMSEALWQKAFAASLPNVIKNEMLASKGKPIMSAKSFDDLVINTSVSHFGTNGIYGLKFRFYLPD